MVKLEILPSIEYDQGFLEEYFSDTIRRFENAALRHRLEDIALNTTFKFMSRLYPSLCDYAENNGHLPKHIVIALSSILLLYKYNEKGRNFSFRDDSKKIELLNEFWTNSVDLDTCVENILSSSLLWETDLRSITGLKEHIVRNLTKIEERGLF